MASEPFDEALSRTTLFGALLAARNKAGGKMGVLEDQDRKVLSYDDVIRAAFALGNKIKTFTKPRERVGVLLPSSAGASVTVIPTLLRLSQTCLCGSVARKSLSERVHRCDCGITVQRDVFSAFLARFSIAVEGPSGPSWRLDAANAQAAFASVESRFPAASSPIGVQTFVAWAREQSASGAPNWDAHLLPTVGSKSERIAGAVGTMARESQDAVAHDVPCERGAREPAQSASGCGQNLSDLSVG